MKIAVTGATGFLGKHLVKRFQATGIDIVILTRKNNDIDYFCNQTGIKGIYGADEKGIETLFFEHPDVQVVIHAATDYGRDESDCLRPFLVNEVFAMSVLKSALQHEIPLFINIDTFLNVPGSKYNYLGSYSLSKRHFQEWGAHVAEKSLISFVNIRLFHLYGPNDSENKFVTEMARKMLSGQEIDLTNGEHGRDFIHIDDAVEGIRLILENEYKCLTGYKEYDLGCGVTIRIRDFLECMNRICGNVSVLNFGALPVRSGEFMDFCADTQLIKKIGWRQRVDIESGIRSVLSGFS